MDANVEEGVLLVQQTSLVDRRTAALEAATRLSLTMPVLVDDMDEAAADAFAAWPERLVVIDRAGRIADPGMPGPFGFDPDAAGGHLAQLIAQGAG